MIILDLARALVSSDTLRLEAAHIETLGLPLTDAWVELAIDGESYEVRWHADERELAGDGLAFVLREHLDDADEVAVFGDHPNLQLDSDVARARRELLARAQDRRPDPARGVSRAQVPSGSVDKVLTERALTIGAIGLGPVEAERLGLESHSHDLMAELDGEHFPVRWHARDRRLESESLADGLQLNGLLGGRARLERHPQGHLAIVLLEPDASSRRTTFVGRSSTFWEDDEAAPTATSANRPRRRRRPDARSLRLRTDGDFTWQGRIGIHKEAVSGLRTRMQQRQFDSEQWALLRLTGEELSLLDSFEYLLAPDVLALEPFPWQEAAARTVLSRLRGRAVLADEVGLGKTIEAGLLIKELVLRGQASRILISCPSTLREQWREELAEKFDEDFRVIERSSDIRHGGDRLIMSPQMLHQNVDRLAKDEWDVLVLDEAHKWMGAGGATRASHQRLAGRFAFLLTATPVQNNLDELYRLVQVLRPGTFTSLRDFRGRYLDRGNTRRPVRTTELRQLVSDVMVRTTRAQAGIDRVQRSVTTQQVALSPRERLLYDTVITVLREPSSRLNELQRRGLALRLLSSPRGLAKSAARMADRTPDRATTGLLQDVAELAADIGTSGEVTTRQERLLDLLNDWLPRHSRVLVFSQHTDTVEDLLRVLEDAGIKAAGFHGKMSASAKGDAVRSFRGGHAKVLVSSDAGAEGQNLQFAYCVVNYDLPWNPMRIEQRIGRVHRLNQTSDVVHVANFVTVGTIDERVYQLLSEKLEMFELLFGQVTTILGELEGEDDARSFEGRIVRALSSSDAEMNTRLEQLGAALAAARSRSAEGLTTGTNASAWLDQSEQRAHHRQRVTEQDASELLPEVRERDQGRQRAVQSFVRELLITAGGEVLVDTTADDNATNGTFLSVRLPDEVGDVLGGAHALHLAFDQAGLANHPEAELCAAGTEIFDELLAFVRTRGGLVVTEAVSPDLDSVPTMDHHRELELVRRWMTGSRASWSTSTWHLSTGEGTDERIHTLVSGPAPRWTLARQELAPQTILSQGDEALAEKWSEQATMAPAAFEEVARELDEAREASLEAEKAKLVAHYDQRMVELRQEQSRVGYRRREEIEERLVDLSRARAAANRSEAAPTRLRAEPLTLRVEFGEDLTVHEEWRRPDGTNVEVSWPFAPNEPPTVIGSDGHAIGVLAICSDGHAVDDANLRTCPACHEDRCDACRKIGVFASCGLCGREVCGSCLHGQQRCSGCQDIQRDRSLDTATRVGFRLDSGLRVLVGHRSGTIHFSDGEVIAVADDEGEREPRRRILRTWAKAQDVDPDVDACLLGTLIEPERDDNDLRMEIVDHVDAMVVESAVGAACPAAPDTLIMALEGVQDQQDSAITVDIPEAVLQLFAELRERDDLQLPPLPWIGLQPHRSVRRTRIDPNGLRYLMEKLSGVDDQAVVEVVDDSLTPWEQIDEQRPDAVLVAQAAVGTVEVELLRRHRGLLIRSVVDGQVQADRWLDSDDTTPGDERHWHLILRALNAEDAVVINPDDPAPIEPRLGFAKPVIPKLLERRTARRWRLASVEGPIDHGATTDRAWTSDPEPLTELAQNEIDPSMALPAPTAASLLARFVPDRTVQLAASLVVSERWKDTGTCEVDYEVDPRAAALPPGTDGTPLADFRIDGAGHLHAPAEIRRCQSCDRHSCSRCVGSWAIAPCPSCASEACDSCRTDQHPSLERRSCVICEVANCLDCGRNHGITHCVQCGRDTCATCIRDQRCPTCLGVRTATDAERDALPRYLALLGADVRVAADATGTIVTITTSERRELVELREGEVIRWWDLLPPSPLRAMKRQVATWAGIPSDLDLRTRGHLPDPSPTPETVALASKPRRSHLAVRITLDDQVLRESQPPPGATPEVPWDVWAETTGAVPWEIDDPAPVPAPFDDLQPTGEEPEVARAVVGLEVQTLIDEVVLTPRGVTHRTGDLHDPVETTSEWRSLDPAAELPSGRSEPVAPSSIMQSSTPTVVTTLVRTGDDLVAHVRAPDMEGWFDVRSDDVGRQRVALARHLELDGIVGSVAHVPSEVKPGLHVTNGSCVERRVEVEVSAQPLAHGVGETPVHGAFKILDLIPPPPRKELPPLPDPLTAIFRSVADARMVPTCLDVTLSYRVRERWLGALWHRSFDYLMTPSAPHPGVAVEDRDEPVPAFTVDRERHLVASPSICPSCGDVLCQRCSLGLAQCELCGWTSCGKCRPNPPLGRCVACTTLRKVSRKEAKQFGLPIRMFGAALAGADAAHAVTFAQHPGGWKVSVRRVIGPASFAAGVKYDVPSHVHGILDSIRSSKSS